jgi:hypothetical protein
MKFTYYNCFSTFVFVIPTKGVPSMLIIDFEKPLKTLILMNSTVFDDSSNTPKWRYKYISAQYED